MPSSKVNEYERNNLLADKLRDGTISKKESNELYWVIDRYIRMYERVKFKRAAWATLHLDRVLLFYELLTEYYYDKSLGYVMSAFRFLSINIETLLHLRAQGVSIGTSIRVVNTMQILNLYIYERYIDCLNTATDSKPKLKQVWVAERERLGITSNGKRAWRNFCASIEPYVKMKPFIKSWYNFYWEGVAVISDDDTGEYVTDAIPLWGEVQTSDLAEETYIWNE